MTLSASGIEGKYDIVRKLHDGGMGSIYLVRHHLLDELRIIKVMRGQLAGDAQFRDRFLQEARLATSLKHPNIAGIHDFTADEHGTGIIVMEYIDGVSLEEILTGGTLLSIPLVLEIARQALRALGYLHREGYVHRDISPDNIMLAEDVDGRPQIKLIDLGIVKKIDGGEGLTTAGHFLGKLRYSSPEHFGELGASGAVPSSDVYSFGLVLYELLTGEQAVRGSDLHSYCSGHVHRPPTPFEETDPHGRVPEDLRRHVLRALAKTIGHRFENGKALADALEPIHRRMPLDDGSDQVKNALAATRRSSGTEGKSFGSTQDRLDRHFSLKTKSETNLTHPPEVPKTKSSEWVAIETFHARREEPPSNRESTDGLSQRTASKTLIITNEATDSRLKDSRSTDSRSTDSRSSTHNLMPSILPLDRQVPKQATTEEEHTESTQEEFVDPRVLEHSETVLGAKSETIILTQIPPAQIPPLPPLPSIPHETPQSSPERESTGGSRQEADSTSSKGAEASPESMRSELPADEREQLVQGALGTHSENGVEPRVVELPAVPGPLEAVVSEPAALEAVASKPSVSESVISEPVVSEPVISESVASESVASESVISEPVISEAVVSEPVVSEPAISEPVISEPVVSEPVISEPVVSEPVTSEAVTAAPSADPLGKGSLPEELNRSARAQTPKSDEARAPSGRPSPSPANLVDRSDPVFSDKKSRKVTPAEQSNWFTEEPDSADDRPAGERTADGSSTSSFASAQPADSRPATWFQKNRMALMILALVGAFLILVAILMFSAASLAVEPPRQRDRSGLLLSPRLPALSPQAWRRL